MQLRNRRDFWAGVLFIVAGLAFALLSHQYPIGTAAKMGPGYFPMVLGGLLALLGLIVLAGAFARNGPSLAISAVGWRELGLVLAAVVLFALMLPSLGFALALVGLIGVAAIASHEFSLRDTLISIIVLGLMSYLVFIKGLELQFLLWPKWFDR